MTTYTTDMRGVADCGHRVEHDGIGTGYAIWPNGLTSCYTCSDARQREELARRTSEPYTGYVSGDGKTFTTWTGGKLGRIVYENKGRRGERYHYQVRTPDGRLWWGRNGGMFGGRGCALTIRPYKHQG